MIDPKHYTFTGSVLSCRDGNHVQEKVRTVHAGSTTHVLACCPCGEQHKNSKTDRNTPSPTTMKKGKS